MGESVFVFGDLLKTSTTLICKNKNIIMKTIQIFATLFMAFLITNNLTAQNIRGFGGLSYVNTTLVGDWTSEVGGLGGGFINENFYVGGCGFGLSQKKEGYEYDMGYGGLMLGYLWGGNSKTSINFYVLGGYGGISEDANDIKKESDDFWAVRPAVEVDFHITDWLRIGVGGGYRWVTGSNISSLDNSDLSAPFGSITFRFGNWEMAQKK